MRNANTSPRWAGQTVVCVASGPSLLREDVDFVRNRARVIVVNREFETAPWADVCYAADYRFWETYMVDIRSQFFGELWTMSGQAATQYGINCIGRASGEGYSPIPHTLNTGGNSGYQAVHLAAYWGASRIVLLGYDMQRTGGLEHHYGKHKGRLPNGRGFPLWVRRFGPLVRDLKRMGVSVINCSRTTALRQVDRTPLSEVVW